MLKNFSYLEDIAHSIAHPESKNQGDIRRDVGNCDSIMTNSLAKMPTFQVRFDPVKNFLYPRIPQIKELSADGLITALINSLPFVFNFNINAEKIAAVRDNLLLCFYSILHMTQIHFDEQSITEQLFNNVEVDLKSLKGAWLAIHSFEGFYQLYAGHQNSKTAHLISGGDVTGRTPTVNIFDKGVKMNGAVDLNTNYPRIVFAARDALGKLVLTDMP